MWREIKAATNEICVRHGGTVTHHHAVGRDHRSGYERQTPELHREALRAVKARLDPRGTLNPGVLIDTAASVLPPAQLLYSSNSPSTIGSLS